MENIKQDRAECTQYECTYSHERGQSLTAPLGDRPWQKPARFSTPDVH